MASSETSGSNTSELGTENEAHRVALEMEESAARSARDTHDKHNPSEPPRAEIAPGFPLNGPYLNTPPSNGDHWEQCHLAVERYDNDMCKSWREEIDTLLVFAGLFTAIVTAFTVESYQWMQPDPADTTNQLLSELVSLQKGGSLPPVSDTFTIPAYAVRVNCFWFLSITISLASGIIGILCKQWMREFQRDAALPPKEALALRQLRYAGWKRWGVPHIISLPAILLQLSLLLFLGGLLDMLWSKLQCHSVAICASVAIGLIAASMALTTALPLAYFLYVRWRRYAGWRGVISQCPYKSPQSYLLLRLWDILGEPTFRHLRLVRWRFLYHFNTWITMERNNLVQRHDLCGQRSLTHQTLVHYQSKALDWVLRTLAFNNRLRDNLVHCLQESPIACQRDGSKFHLLAPRTEEKCEKDHFPHFPLRSLYAQEPLGTEVLLRHLIKVNEHYDYNFWEDPQHPMEEPRVATQVLNYAHYCCKHREENTSSMWACIFKKYLPESNHNSQIKQLLRIYQDRLSSEVDSIKGYLCAREFVYSLNFEHVQDTIKDAQKRSIFQTIFSCVTRSHQYLQQNTHPSSEDWMKRAQSVIADILEHPSTHPEAPDDDSVDPAQLHSEGPMRVVGVPMMAMGSSRKPESHVRHPHYTSGPPPSCSGNVEDTR